ncbi:MAG: UPF0280 family protein [Candidatus Lernaella stagnicola]|nr:UPF0280 family protein [Candidatus Lernaella stagnicola]
MTRYENRLYRNFAPTRTTAFRVTIGQSDLFVRADRDLQTEVRDTLLTVRYQIERYIQTNAAFAISLESLADDPLAPPVCRKMLSAGRAAGVGPLAAVAGAVAEEVAEKVGHLTREIIIENGGDLYLKLTEDLVVGVHTGKDSPFSDKIGLKISAASTPCSLCTSSGQFGHSFSFGEADAVTVLASSACLADAAATAVANLVQSPADIDAALARAREIEGVMGAAVFAGDKMGLWGDLELVNLTDS